MRRGNFVQKQDPLCGIPEAFFLQLLLNYTIWKFWGGMCYHASTPLFVVLSPDNSGITRFIPWSSIATGNILDRTKEIPKFAQTTSTLNI